MDRAFDFAPLLSDTFPGCPRTSWDDIWLNADLDLWSAADE